MDRPHRRTRTDRRGSTALEALFVVPILLAVLLAVVEFAQEQQGDVQVLRLHPLHFGPARRECGLQVGDAVADVVADVETDERAGAGH